MNKIVASILVIALLIFGGGISKNRVTNTDKPIYENIKIRDSYIEANCEIKDGQLHCELKNINDTDTIYVCTMSDVIYHLKSGDFTLTYSNYTTTSMEFPIEGRVLVPYESFQLEVPEDFKTELEKVFNHNKTGIKIFFEFDYINMQKFPKLLSENNIIMKIDYMRYSKKFSFVMKPVI
jgi:hypothetical protein